MIEMIVKPKRAERRPWEMFFIGILYASISLLLVSFVFSKDSVLNQYGGILMITFTVICSLPFMYYLIKLEEGKDVEISKSGRLLKEHSKAISALIWLFMGFVVAFSFWYLVLPEYTPQNFNAQIKVFCAINNPANFDYCIQQHGISSPVTGNVARQQLLINIFANNIYVLIFTVLFSLAFGAGAIFVLAWNASVIAAAVGIFAEKSLVNLPIGILRYMIHGIPEIGAYFIGALAGGIISVAIIRKDLEGERMWRILQDSLLLMIIAIVILFVAALVEVYITPNFF
ncbi:MAG: stage II sporulation protein M [Nanoarchaeota archaeon]|nr:stage II sporulation protein M [Nanoarchaeota archaeon]